MWKKILIPLFTIVLVGFTAISLIITFKKDALIAQAIEGLNQKLDAKIAVNGEIDITFFSTFPEVTLEINQIKIQDKFDKNNHLANLERINLTINPMSLFGENLKFKSIALSEGTVFLKTTKEGLSNYDILKKEQNAQTDSSNINIDLEKIQLVNIDLVYQDKKANIFLDTYVYAATISGKFSKTNFDLKVKLDTKSKKLSISSTDFLTDNLVEAQFDLYYEEANQCIQFKQNSLNIDDNFFEIDGTICSGTNEINLVAKAKGNQLENALKLIPKDLFSLENISGKGKYEVEVILKDKLNKPNIVFHFNIDNGDVQYNDLSLSKLFLKGSFANKPYNQLNIQHFECQHGDSRLKGKLSIPNLEQKSMQLNAEGKIYGDVLQDLGIKNMQFENDGTIDLKNVALFFNYNENDSAWYAAKLSGEFMFKNITGNIKTLDQDFSFNGSFLANENSFTIPSINVKIGDNDIAFAGTIRQALGFFQPNYFSVDKQLVIEGKLDSKQFDINTFMTNSSQESIENDEDLDLQRWLNLNTNIDLNIEKLLYNKLIVSDLSAQIESSLPGIFNINQLKAKSLGGTLQGDLVLGFSKTKTLDVSIVSKVSNINMQDLFIAFDDFDQTALTHKNIKGTLDADIQVKMAFDNLSQFKQDKLLVNTQFELKNGELIALESLKSLSKYLSVKQLDHLYFTNLKTNVSIIDKVLYLDNTKIQSNVLSLELGGSHGFDQSINYLMTLNLNNVLAAKFKVNKTLDEDYVNDAKGGVNLYISMKGTVDNPIIKLVKKAALLDEKEKGSDKIPIIDIKDAFKQTNLEKADEKTFYYDTEADDEFIEFEE